MDESFAPGIAAISDDWMKYLPQEIRQNFIKAQVRSKLNALDDQTPLTQDLASIYLDVSDATLKRMRANGKGPQYVQGAGEEGSTGRNQKVLYTVGALKDWITKNKTDSTGHAAIRRGLMFQSAQDLLVSEPWWKDAAGNIVGHAYECDPLSEYDSLIWLSLLEVLGFNFHKQDIRDLYSKLVRAALTDEAQRIVALDEKFKISSAI